MLIEQQIKRQIKYNHLRFNFFKLSQISDAILPSDNERRKNAEVSTPYALRQEMLNSITEHGDVEFWKTPKTVFEPCCGKGGFVVDIIERFMNDLAEMFPDKAERYRYIIEHCIYFADINPLNIFITRLLLDPFGKYKLNYYLGDTLKIDIEHEFKLEGFDLVVGNPPYQKSSTAEVRKGGYGGRSIWNKFVEAALNSWCKSDKYLLFIHPPSWRKPEHYLWKTMTAKQIIYIKMFSKREGLRLFHCATATDYYLLQNIRYVAKTYILGQDKQTYHINLADWVFLPSGKITVIENILGHQEIIYSRTAYGTDKKWISNTKSAEYKYPAIHTMTRKGNTNVWSNENKGHIGVKKVILNFNEYQYPYNDWDGKYGMSQICYGIKIKDKTEGELICKSINSQQFKEVIKYTKWSTFQTDWRMFKFFRKDFWREFIDDEEK